MSDNIAMMSNIVNMKDIKIILGEGRGEYGFCHKRSFETLFQIMILLISLRSFHFHIGLVKVRSENNEICQRFPVLSIPIMVGFGWLIMIVKPLISQTDPNLILIVALVYHRIRIGFRSSYPKLASAKSGIDIPYAHTSLELKISHQFGMIKKWFS